MIEQIIGGIVVLLVGLLGGIAIQKRRTKTPQRHTEETGSMPRHTQTTKTPYEIDYTSQIPKTPFRVDDIHGSSTPVGGDKEPDYAHELDKALEQLLQDE